MITWQTDIAVQGVSGTLLSDFMLHCTSDEYRAWWPGTHLSFITTRRYPGDLGNHVRFDEYIGARRVKFQGIVVRHETGREIIWQMRAGVRLPAWLALEFRDTQDGVVIRHILRIGYKGFGRLLDPLFRLYVTDSYKRDIAEHAQEEFTMLAAILSGKQPNLSG